MLNDPLCRFTVMFVAFIALTVNTYTAYDDALNHNELLIQENQNLTDLVGNLVTDRALLFNRIYEIELIEMDIADKTPSLRPAPGRISSYFGVRRIPYRRGEYQFHTGIDIVGKYGEDIIATATGIVIHATRTGTYGKMIVIDHGYGYTTHYGHLCRYYVGPGEEVLKGQVIGGMGKTGRTTGVHVHYEVRLFGTPVNPMKYIP